MRSQFEKVVQNFELKMIGVAPKNHQLTPLHVVSTQISLRSVGQLSSKTSMIFVLLSKLDHYV